MACFDLVPRCILAFFISIPEARRDVRQTSLVSGHSQPICTFTVSVLSRRMETRIAPLADILGRWFDSSFLHRIRNTPSTATMTSSAMLIAASILLLEDRNCGFFREACRRPWSSSFRSSCSDDEEGSHGMGALPLSEYMLSMRVKRADCL